MANTYDLGSDFNGTKQGSISVSPYWLVVVYRYENEVLYDKVEQRSAGTDAALAFKISKKVVIDTDCVNVSVSTNKGSPTAQASLTLLPGKNYLTEIFPGDWMAIWIVNSREKYLDLKRRIEVNEPCNDFDDGLKFLGKVSAINMSLTVDPSGLRSQRFGVSGTAFEEFMVNTFYHPVLAQAIPTWGEFIARLELVIEEFMKDASISSQLIIPVLLDLMLGRGIPEASYRPGEKGKADVTIGYGLTHDSSSVPYAFGVPAEIPRLLGIQIDDPFTTSYASIVQRLIGVQGYRAPTDEKFAPLIPDIKSVVMGEFQPTPPDFTNRPVWQILSQYVNPAVNEMYTCLRVTPKGTVIPTLVVRQQPYVSPMLAESGKLTFPYTAFLDVCRWKAPQILVTSLQVGRSDSNRVNFMHLGATAPFTLEDVQPQEQLLNVPPITDELDIKRSGIRIDIGTINCSPEEAHNYEGQARWMQQRSDFLFGQHLMLFGSVSMVGIQAPICHGDNFELDGMVYHISGVNHDASIDATGNKRFTTSLDLSCGIVDVRAPDAPPIRNALSSIYFGVSGPDKAMDSNATEVK